MIYDSEGNGRLISEADDGNWYDSDGNYYGSWEDIEDAMVNENGVTDQDGNKYYWTAPHDASEEVTDPYDLYSWDQEPIPIYRFRLRNLTVVLQAEETAGIIMMKTAANMFRGRI